MTFQFGSPELLGINNSEIDLLLKRVYVDEGYTSEELAQSIFAPEAVRKRGVMICSRSKETGKFSGMIIVVFPGSSARRLAYPDEAEMHLLAVDKENRGFGLGRELVNQSIEIATSKGFSKMVLWTQPSMKVAQKLYESVGFNRAIGRDFSAGGRQFYVYEKYW